MNFPDLISDCKAPDEEIMLFLKAAKDFEIRFLLIGRDQNEGLLLVTSFKVQWFSWPGNLMTWYPLVFTSSLYAVFQWIIRFCIEIKPFFVCDITFLIFENFYYFCCCFAREKHNIFYIHLTLCNTPWLGFYAVMNHSNIYQTVRCKI